MNGRSSDHGFTLVELLVVVAIVAILSGLLLPALSSAKENGRMAKWMGNVHQIAVAVSLYVQDEHFYPPMLYHSLPCAPAKAWYENVKPYLGNWTNGVFVCPSFKYKQVGTAGGLLQQVGH